MISKTNKGNRYKYRWKSSGNTIKGWTIPQLESWAVQKLPKKYKLKTDEYTTQIQIRIKMKIQGDMSNGRII